MKFIILFLIISSQIFGQKFGKLGLFFSDDEFNPVDLPSIIEIWETDYGVSKLSGSDSVGSWLGKVNGLKFFNYDTVINIPWSPQYIANFVNGKPAILGDGTNDRFRLITADSISVPMTIYLVINMKTWVNNATLFSGSANSIYHILNSGVAAEMKIRSTSTSSALTYPDSTWIVVTGVFNGANSLITYNNATPVTVSLTDKKEKTFHLFASNVLLGANFYVAAVAIFNTTHDVATKTKILNYFYNKYGIIP